ncbi:MAG: PAS domain-containing protein, partial [Verrucomicrobiae bacterium]|nr:PAS domain-containing protein [Verrucomicrobiae bacterium]
MPSSSENSDFDESWPLASALYCDLDSHRAMLQSIIDHSPADICLKGLDGRYLLVNRNFGMRVGMDPALVVGKTGYDFFAREEADRKTANDRLVLADGKSRQFEEMVTLADGLHILLSEKFPVCDEKGNITGICGIYTDITHRKADKEKLHRLSDQVQQQGRTLETVLSASPNIVYMFDNQGRMVYANQAGAARFKLRPVELIGKTWKTLCQERGGFDGFTEKVSR